MTVNLTIQLSDAAYEAVRAAAERAHQSPEELIAATLAERYGEIAGTPQPLGEDPLIQVMRERGHLVDPKSYLPYPGVDDLPPRGSPERAQLEKEIGEELSDAVERSGLSIVDLIERR